MGREGLIYVRIVCADCEEPDGYNIMILQLTAPRWIFCYARVDFIIERLRDGCVIMRVVISGFIIIIIIIDSATYLYRLE